MKKMIMVIAAVGMFLIACKKENLSSFTETSEYNTVIQEDGFRQVRPAPAFTWYINGDKTYKMLKTVYGLNKLSFPDSIVTLKVFEMQFDTIAKGQIDTLVGPLVATFNDLMHHNYNVNNTLFNLGYSEGDQFWTFIYNKNDVRIYLPDFIDHIKLQLVY